MWKNGKSSCMIFIILVITAIIAIMRLFSVTSLLWRKQNLLICLFTSLFYFEWKCDKIHFFTDDNKNFQIMIFINEICVLLNIDRAWWSFLKKWDVRFILILHTRNKPSITADMAVMIRVNQFHGAISHEGKSNSIEMK